MEKLKNIPFFLLFIIYLGWLGVQAYQFEFSSDGAVETHKIKIDTLKNEITSLKKKVVEAKEFEKSLDTNKEDLRKKVKKMFEYESMFSERIDVPSLMKLLLTEAKRVDLKLEKIEPVSQSLKEFYVEQEFKMKLNGDYTKMLLFLQRIAQMQRLMRVNEVELTANSNSTSVSSQKLSGIFSIKAYRYTNSKEDTMAGAFK
jgi:Tfp pilus assembly protein PilO